MKALRVVISILIVSSAAFSIDNLKQAPVAEYCQKARQFLVEGKYQQALAASKQALDIDPQSAEADHLAGQAELALGDLNASQQYLERALKRNPEIMDSRRVLGIVFLKKKQYQKAQLQFETVLTSLPSDYISRYSLGLSLLFQNQPQKALDEFQKAQKLRSPNTALMTALLETYIQLDRMAQASATLQALDQQLSGHDAARMQLAEFLVREKAYALSAEEFERLVKDHPDSPDLSYDLALADHRAGKEAEAEALLRKLIARQDTAEFEDLLGDVEEKAGKSAAAIAAFRRAANLDKGNIDYRYDYAQSLENSGRLDEAIEVFSEGIRDSPRAAKLWMGLGASYYLAGRYNKAAQALLQAAQIAPNTPEAYVLLGIAFDAAGSLQNDIMRRFASYLAENPRDANAHYYYGKILFSASQRSASSADLEQARKHLSEAIKLNPNLAPAHTELGILLNKQGQTQQAQAELETSIRLDPQSSTAYYTLAQVYRKLGQKDQAKTALQKFEQLKNKENKNRDQEAVKDFLSRPKERR